MMGEGGCGRMPLGRVGVRWGTRVPYITHVEARGGLRICGGVLGCAGVMPLGGEVEGRAEEAAEEERAEEEG